ncbi:MAG: hypothetical protein JXR69_11615 [Candidatus Delongbacteria bacterium]|nr:hypothetical protein [Candidatus Delongbacteria bacterium]
MKKLLCITVILLFCQLIRAEIDLNKSIKLFILPNFCINSFNTYNNDILDAYDYSPSFGLDIEYSKKTPWRIVGKLNYYLVPDWFPLEFSFGIKKVNDIKILKSFQYYWNVNLDSKVLRYTGPNGKWGYDYIFISRVEPPFYLELNNGDWMMAIGIDLIYGLNYFFRDTIFLDFQVGYKLYSFYLKDNKFIELYAFDSVDGSHLKPLEGNDDFVNPDGFFLKFGLGVGLW